MPAKILKLGLLLLLGLVISAKVVLQPAYLQVDFFDIGQGDSILITTPQNFQILVDGGPDDAVLEQLRQVMPFFDAQIDWLILTHADQDHLAGLLEVLNNYQVDQVFVSDQSSKTQLYQAWQQELVRQGIKVTTIMKATTIKLAPNIKLEFLPPYQGDPASLNNSSLTFRLIYNQTSFLFPGDVEVEAEEYLVANHLDSLPAQLLKVAHHGSKTSSTQQFIKAVNPQLAIIQVSADNSYGHPSLRVLHRYQQFNIDILRTDQEGRISINSDGQVIWQDKGWLGQLKALFSNSSEKVYNMDKIQDQLNP